MMNLMEKKITAEVARWGVVADYERIPSEIVKRLRYQILGMLGSFFGSLRTDMGKRFFDHLVSIARPGEIPVPATDKKVSLEDALRIYTSMSMLLDYDDYLFMGHTGHSAVWTSLLAGLKFQKSSREILTGIAIGNEAGGRLGGAVLLGPHNGQMWSFIHGVNSALIYGRFSGLDFEQILNAVSLYLYQPHYPLYPGFMNSDAKILTAARPVIEGIHAVEIARGGFGGYERIIEGKRGLLENFSIVPFDFLISDFGRSWVTYSLAVKIYPGCAYIDTTMDALNEIFREKEIDPDKIREVHIRANLLTFQMNRIAEDYFDPAFLSPININFNLKINTALFLLNGRLTPELLSVGYLSDNRRKILNLAERIKIEHWWPHTFDTIYAAFNSMNWEKLIGTTGHLDLKNLKNQLEKYHGSSGVEISMREFLHLRKVLPPEKKKFLHRIILKSLKNRVVKGEEGDFSLKDINFEKFSMPFGVDVEIVMENGSTFGKSVSIPEGVSYKEGFEEKVKMKFIENALPFIGRERSEEVIEIVENFEEKPAYLLFEKLTG